MQLQQMRSPQLDGTPGIRKFAASLGVRLAGINWALVAILVAALALRLLRILDYNASVPDAFSTLGGDEPGYANLARGLWAGDFFSWPGRVPLYPAFIASVFVAAGHESYRWVRIVQCFVGLIPVWLTYLLGRRIFGKRAGLIAALLVAVCFPLYVEPRVVLSENLFTPMLLAIAWLTLDAVERPTGGRFAILGVSIGIADLIRPTLALYPLFMMIALPVLLPRKRAWRLGVVAGLAAGITIFPWTLHNYIRYHALIPLATSNAAVWQASPEFDHVIKRIGYMRVWREVLYGPGWEKHDPTSVEGDKYWTERGLRSIRQAPLEYLAISFRRIFLYWVGDPGNDWNNGPPLSYKGLREAGYVPSEAGLLMIERLVPLLIPLAVFVLWSERRRFFTLYMMLLFATLFHAATIAVARLSEPFLPFVMTLIACAFDRLTGAPTRT